MKKGTKIIKREYIKGDHKFIITKNNKGLYDYKSKEYSYINKCWVNMSHFENFTKVALQDWLDIVIDF